MSLQPAHVPPQTAEVAGIGIEQLHIVFTALIVSRVLYALPAWGGFSSSDVLNSVRDRNSGNFVF